MKEGMQEEDFAYLYALEESFWWFVGMREITGALLDAVLPPSQARMILDAGCGTGGMLSWLPRFAGRGRVVGIDVVASALRFCRERHHTHLAQASATHLPFADSTFDFVTSFDVLVQLPGEGAAEQAIREMYRLLRPGGIAFVRVAAYEWMRSGHDEALGTQRRYNLRALTCSMEGAGFNTLRATYANTLLLPAAALRRLVLKRVGLVDSGSDVKPLPSKLEWLNRVLANALLYEARILRNPRATFPAGLSVICISQKPHA